jgi:hypothetical protein
MGLISFCRSLYDLDTLDTRFTNTSSTPYKVVVESRNDPIASKERTAAFSGKAQPSKWKTPEFIFYQAWIYCIIPYMFWVAYDASKSAFGSLGPSGIITKTEPNLHCSLESSVQKVRTLPTPRLDTRPQDSMLHQPRVVLLVPCL